MRHRIFWPLVACLGLGGLTLVISQSTAKRAPGGAGGPGGPAGMPGGMPGMPGRFVVANASATQVLILDTATGQVYRAKEEDFKKMSDLPVMGGGHAPADNPRGRDGRGGAEDRRPEVKDNARPGDRRPEVKDAPRPGGRDARPAPKDDAPPRRNERE